MNFPTIFCLSVKLITGQAKAFKSNLLKFDRYLHYGNHKFITKISQLIRGIL